MPVLIEKEIEQVYALMILGMDLCSESGEALFNRPPPFAFTVNKAIKILTGVRQASKSGSIVLCTKLTMTKESAKRLLSLFGRARLVHCPLERALQNMRPKLVLQPTAKGLAIVERYVKRNYSNYPRMNELVYSSCNTMTLLRLERSLSSSELLFSQGSMIIIWNHMLGSKPNVYNPEFPPSLVQVRTRGDDAVAKEVESPYFHKFFTHPSSNASSQYFDATGVKIFENVSFQSRSASNERYRVRYVVTGKTLWQWLMDCTDIMSPEEAVHVVQILVKNEFVEQIMDQNVDAMNFKDTMPSVVSRETLYRITKRGFICSEWKDNYWVPDEYYHSTTDVNTESLSVGLSDTVPKTVTEPNTSNSKRNSSEDTTKAAPEIKQSDRVKEESVPVQKSSDKRSLPLDFLRQKGYLSKAGAWGWLNTEPGIISLKNLTLREILADPGLKMLFRRHIDNSQRGENLVFLDEFTSFESTYNRCVASNQVDASKEAFILLNACRRTIRMLIYRFLMPTSPCCLNLRSKLSTEVANDVFCEPATSSDENTSETILSHVVSKMKLVQDHVVLNLREAAAEFVESDAMNRVIMTKYVASMRQSRS